MTTTAQRLLTASLLTLLVCLLIGWSASRAEAIPQGQLAFQSQSGGGSPEITVINLDGGGRMPITSNSVDDYTPAWSPNGSKIAETRQVSSSPIRYGIIIMNADGTGPHEISGTNDDGSSDWDTDGVHLVMNSYRDGSAKIWRINDNGTGAVNLSGPDEVFDYEPAVSPDGQKIVFASERTGDREIWVMDANGANQTRLTYSGVNNYNPAWSPDGLTIIYSSFRAEPSEIWAIDADGSNDHQLTFLEDQGGASGGQYSPDGAYIAFSGGSGLFTMTAAGEEITKIPNTTSNDYEPTWRPNLLAGDADCDHAVNLLDVLHALQAQAGAPSNAASCLSAANVKCDDAFGMADIRLILAYVAGVAAEVPSGCRPINELLG